MDKLKSLWLEIILSNYFKEGLFINCFFYVKDSIKVSKFSYNIIGTTVYSFNLILLVFISYYHYIRSNLI